MKPKHATLLQEGPPGPVAIRLLGVAVDWAVVAIGALMVAMVFANVAMHAAGRDIAWVTEFGEFLMVWVTFLGAASATRRGAHMTITEFVDKLDRDRRRYADLAIQGAAATILGLLLWYGVAIVRSTWSNTLTVLDIPMGLQYLALPVGAAVMLVFVLFDLLQIARGKAAAERYGT